MLRAKYFDWCSAQVADRFLSMTPDEVYALAEASVAGQALAAATTLEELAAAEGAGPKFRWLVKRATEVLSQRIGLPTFEQWAQAYGESPEQFEGELLGLWWEELDRKS